MSLTSFTAAGRAAPDQDSFHPRPESLLRLTIVVISSSRAAFESMVSASCLREAALSMSSDMALSFSATALSMDMVFAFISSSLRLSAERPSLTAFALATASLKLSTAVKL